MSKAQGWDSVALERVTESTQEGRGAELGAIICGEGTLLLAALIIEIYRDGADMSEGVAAICLVSEHMTTIRQRIEVNVPRKRKGGTSGHDKVSLDLISAVERSELKII